MQKPSSQSNKVNSACSALISQIKEKASKTSSNCNLQFAVSGEYSFSSTLENEAAICYFEHCIFIEGVLIGNVDLYSPQLLRKVNGICGDRNVAHKSSYIEFARFDADGSKFYVNPRTGKVFVVSLGAVNEVGIIGDRPDKGWGFICTDLITDALMQDVSWKDWNSLREFWADDLAALTNSN